MSTAQQRRKKTGTAKSSKQTTTPQHSQKSSQSSQKPANIAQGELKQADTIQSQQKSINAVQSPQKQAGANKNAFQAAPRPNKRGRRQAARSRASWWLWGGVASLLVAVVVAFFIFNSLNNFNQGQSSPGSPGGSTIPGVVTYTGLSREHTTAPVKYAQNPPVGGPHNPVWQNCGIYTTPLINEHAVHSLEHGAVWITYQPSLSASEIAALQNIVQGHSYLLLSPYPGLPAPIVLSAWGLQLEVNSVSDPRIKEFIADYEQGPQTPEPGAACTGGYGTPDIP
jgi:hypothetical protein